MSERATVLLAEDNPSVRAFTQRALDDLYDVTPAANGLQALSLLQQAPFQVLVADINMPLLDGIELAMQAVVLQPELRVVLISGYADERLRVHQIDALVHQLLAKPFSLEEIRDAVKAALALP